MIINNNNNLLFSRPKTHVKENTSHRRRRCIPRQKRSATRNNRNQKTKQLIYYFAQRITSHCQFHDWRWPVGGEMEKKHKCIGKSSRSAKHRRNDETPNTQKAQQICLSFRLACRLSNSLKGALPNLVINILVC